MSIKSLDNTAIPNPILQFPTTHLSRSLVKFNQEQPLGAKKWCAIWECCNPTILMLTVDWAALRDLRYYFIAHLNIWGVENLTYHFVWCEVFQSIVNLLYSLCLLTYQLIDTSVITLNNTAPVVFLNLLHKYQFQTTEEKKRFTTGFRKKTQLYVIENSVYHVWFKVLFSVSLWLTSKFLKMFTTGFRNKTNLSL